VTLRYKSDGITWGSLLLNTQDPGKAIAADRNPYSNEVIMRRANSPESFTMRVGDSTGLFSTGSFGTYTYAKHKPSSKTQGFTAPPADLTGAAYVTALRKRKSANSRNHNHDGQNVAYLDGHAKWTNNPKAGVDDDSIWSNWQHENGVPVLDPRTRLPYDAEPPQGNAYGLMRAKSDWATDSVLIP
jgi:prepilin-type processing-associated H-X9-DG protein